MCKSCVLKDTCIVRLIPGIVGCEEHESEHVDFDKEDLKDY